MLVTDPQASDVQVTMRYRVGAADDPADHPGMAHLVEHLMFDHSLDGETLLDRLTSIATYFNGATTLDATTYIARARPALLDDLLAIEAARVTSPCSSIGNAEFERERAVVQNELRQRAQASELTAVLTDALFPADHAYHRRLGGTVDSVAAISLDQACAFASSYYAIGNAVLVVSGNLTRVQLEAALQHRLAHVEARGFERQRVVQPVGLSGTHVELRAHVDYDTVLVAWPMPTDPTLRTQVRALEATAASSIASDLDASVSTLELGDNRLPVIGILISAPGTASYAYLVNGANRALDALPGELKHQHERIEEFDDLVFGQTRHGALYHRYNTLERGIARDSELASYVARGRDPALTVKQQLDALRDLKQSDAIELARTYLSFEHATVIVLRPSEETPADRRDTSAGDVEDHERPARVDVATAHRPATTVAVPTIPGVTTRKLANGLQVVLRPMSSIPTVDIRLVFRAGTADEPANKRGIAMLAARGLTWDLRYLKDLLLFQTAGALERREVDSDHTTFSVSGMASQLDYLLTGLRRRVREGIYEEGVTRFLKAVRRSHERHDDWTVTSDAWRAALYGPDHPNVRGGVMRLADTDLTGGDAEQFRAEHYTPDNATLVISGDFDPVVVDRWVDFLFADWTGHAISRTAPRAELHRDSLASAVKGTQVTLEIAFPTTIADRAKRLVAAAMLSDLAGEVRLDLGASYSTTARLAEERLSTRYDLIGSIEAARTPAAAKLLADRISRLRSDPDFAARTFVRARSRVLADLASIADSASASADHIEHDIELERSPLSDLGVLPVVRDLTIDQMSAALLDLDLSRALIAMHGPRDAIAAAFDALGRTPTYLPIDVDGNTVEHDDGSSLEAAIQPYHNSVPEELADPLTSRGSPFHFAYAFAVGGSLATVEHDTQFARSSNSYTGASAVVELGYYRHRETSDRFGLRLAVATLAGSAPTLTTLDVAPFAQIRLSDPFWLGAFAGLHIEYDTSSRIGGVAGAQLGLNLVPIKRHWLSLFGQYAYVVEDYADYGAMTFGLAYGH